MTSRIRTLLIAYGLLGARPMTLPAQTEAPLYYDDPTFAWQDNRDPETARVSPSGLVGQQIGSTRVMVAYGRPGVRDRTVFGSLVSYGNVWRTGADEATTITLSGPIEVQGQPLDAGTYALFTIPGVDEWTFIFNRINNQWGAFDYDDEHDALRVTVRTETASHTEWLTFTFENLSVDGASLVLRWEDTKVSLRLVEFEGPAGAARPARSDDGVGSPLFEGELTAYDNVREPNSPASAAGFIMGRDLVAQGEGTFTGERVSGSLDWSLLAKRPDPRDDRSAILFVGWMETEDGAEVMYEATGSATRTATGAAVWAFNAVLRFQEADAPYEWLEDTRATWAGTLDERTGRGQIRALTPALR